MFISSVQWLIMLFCPKVRLPSRHQIFNAIRSGFMPATLTQHPPILHGSRMRSAYSFAKSPNFNP